MDQESIIRARPRARRDGRRDGTYGSLIRQELDRGFWKNLHDGQSIAHPESGDATLGVYSRDRGHNRLEATYACFRMQRRATEVWWPRYKENLETVERSCGRPRHCFKVNARLMRCVLRWMREMSLTCASNPPSCQKLEGSCATQPAVMVISDVVVLLEQSVLVLVTVCGIPRSAVVVH